MALNSRRAAPSIFGDTCPIRYQRRPGRPRPILLKKEIVASQHITPESKRACVPPLEPIRYIDCSTHRCDPIRRGNTTVIEYVLPHARQHVGLLLVLIQCPTPLIVWARSIYLLAFPSRQCTGHAAASSAYLMAIC